MTNRRIGALVVLCGWPVSCGGSGGRATAGDEATESSVTITTTTPDDAGSASGTSGGDSADATSSGGSTGGMTTSEVDTYDQLVGPYTYSDMTGCGLQSVSCGPAGLIEA